MFIEVFNGQIENKSSDVNKDLGFKAKAKDLSFKAKELCKNI